MPIWYSCLVVWARFPRALPSMPSPHAVLLTPPKSSGPTQLPSCKQVAPVSPLDSTLVNSLVSMENKELTENLSLLDSTLIKNRGWGPSHPHFATRRLPLVIRHSHPFPLFSYAYKLPISEALCFDIHANCRGVYGGSQAGFLKYFFNFSVAQTLRHSDVRTFRRSDFPTFRRACCRFAAFPFPAIHSSDGNLAAA